METPHNKCPSPYALEMWALERKDLGGVLTHLEGCQACGAFIKSLQDEKKAFLASNPFEKIAPALDPYLTRPKKSPTHWLLKLAPLGLVALIALMWVSPSVNFKGDVSLEYYIKDGEQSQKGQKNQVVHAGDQIRLLLNPAQHTYAVILSLEANGALHLYYPDSDSESFPVEPGKNLLLPDSIVLDTSPFNELFIAFFSEKPIPIVELENQIKNHLPKDTPLSLEKMDFNFLSFPNASFLLMKGSHE